MDFMYILKFSTMYFQQKYDYSLLTLSVNFQKFTLINLPCPQIAYKCISKFLEHMHISACTYI